MPPARIVAAVLLCAGIGAAITMGAPAAASAATVSTTIANGLEFQADDSDAAAGATVTGYTGTGAALVIPDLVDIAGTNYAVTGVASNTSPIQQATVSGSFTSLVLPDSLTTIGDAAFQQDTSLVAVTFGTGLVSIGNDAFEGDPLTAIDMPHVTEVFAYAFDGAEETSLVLPGSLTTIHGFAFADEPALATVTLPASLTEFSTNAFGYDDVLGSVTFDGAVPNDVAGVGANQTFYTGHGLVVSYQWANDAARQPGGFTTPTWLGYTTRELVTMTFDANGYGTAPAARQVTDGTAVAQPADPTAVGKKFTGWFTSPSLTTTVDFADPVTADVTVYAGWTSLAETGVSVSPIAVTGGVSAILLGGLLAAIARRRRRIARA